MVQLLFKKKGLDKFKPVCVKTHISRWVEMFTCVKYLPKLVSKLIITVAHYPNVKYSFLTF